MKYRVFAVAQRHIEAVILVEAENEGKAEDKAWDAIDRNRVNWSEGTVTEEGITSIEEYE
jgi:hypothetical protein